MPLVTRTRIVHADVGRRRQTRRVEAWAWGRAEEELVDRSGSPWDTEERRPSHADKRKALQGEILRGEIQATFGAGTKCEEFQALAMRLLRLAA